MANAFKFAEGMQGAQSFGSSSPDVEIDEEEENEGPKITEVADDLD